MNDITFNIQRKTQKAEKQTKKWLQEILVKMRL